MLLIGTRRGLFVARPDAQRDRWSLSEPVLTGREVYHAIIDPRDGTLWAATNHAVWGAHVHRSTDLGETWELLEAAPHYADARGIEAIWFLAPGPASAPQRFYAGIEPAGLFVSDDAGTSWQGVDALNEHATNASWQPAGGALALHAIQHDPRDAQRIDCALSAGGVYRSDDGGTTWVPKNVGTRADFLPDRYPSYGQCVHKLIVHPALPDRLYQQNHCGVYRSDDRGDSWVEITDGLPSDFGYGLATDPRNADVLFTIPEESSHMRTTVGGRLRVYRTTNAGASWHALTDGLPQEHAYVSVLRDALTNDTHDPVGIYFGTSTGHVFASTDAGAHWRQIAAFLPKILSVTAAMVE
ncbi:MAG: WD40/YVTN/BNR-like repeat-containing protein [Longimicrobiales bacterium]